MVTMFVFYCSNQGLGNGISYSGVIRTSNVSLNGNLDYNFNCSNE